MLFGQEGDELDRLRAEKNEVVDGKVVHTDKAAWQPMWKMGVVRGAYAYVKAIKATEAVLYCIDTTGAKKSEWSEWVRQREGNVQICSSHLFLTEMSFVPTTCTQKETDQK